MAAGHQYYEADGAPLDVPADPARVVAAWQSHRTRLRSWFAGLPDDRWSAPTRCMDWNVTDIAQHLLLVTNFLTFTLHRIKFSLQRLFLFGTYALHRILFHLQFFLFGADTLHGILLHLQLLFLGTCALYRFEFSL